MGGDDDEDAKICHQRLLRERKHMHEFDMVLSHMMRHG